MRPNCRACGFEMWAVGVLLVCRRCDTAPHGGGRRWGPPNIPNTADGAFDQLFPDVK